jgi:hypothetical protein
MITAKDLMVIDNFLMELQSINLLNKENINLLHQIRDKIYKELDKTKIKIK